MPQSHALEEKSMTEGLLESLKEIMDLACAIDTLTAENGPHLIREVPLLLKHSSEVLLLLEARVLLEDERKKTGTDLRLEFAFVTTV